LESVSVHEESTTPRVFDVLADAFAQEEVKTCFALLGDANMNWATRLAERGCRLIYVRHEHCAVASAMAYARKTQDVGVASVTCGPGVTQLMTALPAAVRASLPLVVFAGEAPLKSAWYNQGIDQAPMVAATGAAYHSLHFPSRMPTAIRDAFVQARTERRPVVLGIPFDLQNRPWEGEVTLATPSRALMNPPSPLPPAAADVERAAALVAGAERVVVFAGQGAVEAGAGQACRDLAAKTGGLLTTTLPARGLFHDDPFCIGITGSFSTEVGLECVKQADLIVAVGCSLAFHAGGGGQLWPNAEVLHVDINPRSVSQGQTVARHHLRADARLGVEALTAALPARKQSWRNNTLADRIRTEPPDSMRFDVEPGLLDPREAVAALEDALPAEWELVNSSGHCSAFFAQMPSRPNERFLTIREFGAIGNGSSFAMGVAAARPDSTVVLFDGDGSLLMNIQELETIARHGLKILIVVMNDGAYGSEVHKLRSEGLAEAGSVFGFADFAGIAKGFGLDGRTITDAAEIPAAVEDFARSGGAAVWDLRVSDKVVSRITRQAHPPRKQPA
jgi:thiamine pyrophosphate-dependent acetolactate synthase large subunit-like protein